LRQHGKLGLYKFGACAELRFTAELRKFVPRTDRETVVAAIDAVADGGAEVARDMSLVLDREIGNAAARIELIGSGKSGCRTDIETSMA
jgi:hypothetical protein